MRQSIRPVLTSLFLAVMLFFGLGCEKQRTIEIGKETIAADTTWDGIVLVTGDVLVPPGVTLNIAPGTQVKFRRIDENSDRNLFGIDSPYYPQAELIIQGRLVARGTADRKIVFTSAEIKAQPADWGAINLLGSDNNIIEHARILFAYNGIHAHGAEAQVAHCEFARNGVGISFKSEEEAPGVPWFGRRSKLSIIDNQFYKNKGGIAFRNSSAEISNNEIRDNKFFGIWPKEETDAVISYNEITGNKKGVYLYQARGIRLDHNNIYDNSDYNIAVAEAQDFTVEARNNWFGTINRQKIEEMIFDMKDDPDLGEILYEPFLDSKVKWERP